MCIAQLARPRSRSAPTDSAGEAISEDENDWPIPIPSLKPFPLLHPERIQLRAPQVEREAHVSLLKPGKGIALLPLDRRACPVVFDGDAFVPAETLELLRRALVHDRDAQRAVAAHVGVDE